MVDVSAPQKSVAQKKSGRRRTDSAKNDELLMRAAISTIAKHGWDATSAEAIAEAAGLTRGAIYGRYTGIGELSQALWEQTLRSYFLHQLETLCEGVSSTDEGMLDLLVGFAHPTKKTLTSIELILAGTFEQSLKTVVRDVSSFVQKKLQSAREMRDDDVSAAAQATGIALALGLALTSDRSWLKDVDLRVILKPIVTVLRNPGRPTPLPQSRADYMHLDTFSTGDLQVDALLAAAADEIGNRGYAGATISRICRRSRISSGFVYSRYANKRDLLVKLIEAMYARGMESLNLFLAEISQTYSRAVAEAVSWRELQHPDLVANRVLAMEINRLARYDQVMGEAQYGAEKALLQQRLAASSQESHEQMIATFHIGLALGVGFYLLPNLDPSAWTLPFDAITSPLMDAGISFGS